LYEQASPHASGSPSRHSSLAEAITSDRGAVDLVVDEHPANAATKKTKKLRTTWRCSIDRRRMQ
jgi:hypothetical protein